mmetsp:Transcript_19968/g.41098  ORF Transcript_19968/g.41098 Transcript_19968/m.41098 type:complete len:830 (+) Transcript_19968:300-2789(+)
MIHLSKTNKKRSRFLSKTTAATNEVFSASNQLSAFLLLCFSFLCAIVNAADVDYGARSSLVSSGLDSRHQQQQQPTQRDLQTSRTIRPTTLVETFSCIPAAEIQAIHQDRDDDRLPWLAGNEINTACYSQQNSCGSNDGTAPSACCRVSYDAGWLVCDAYNAFDHMPCVCNDNTFGSPTPQPTTLAPTTLEPTNKPTKYPTMKPTDQPTRRPTDQPTKGPTDQPTKGPTDQPTKGPTDQPTNKPTYRPTEKPTNKPTNEPTVSTKSPTTTKPTEEPTSAPIVTPFPTSVKTESPTTQPTLEPTAAPTTRSPTAKPTIPPYYTTGDKYDDDLDATIRQSQCTEDPPVIEFVQASTFVYRYEVTLSTDDAAAVSSVNLDGLYDEKIKEVSELGTRELHDELALEFMECGGGADAYQYDTVWILQSKTHEVDNGAACSTSSSLVSQEEGISVERAKDDTAETDEDSNDTPNDDNNKCVVMKAEARIIAYQSPFGRKTNKQLWSDSNAYENGPVAESFAADAIAFLGSILNTGELENFSSATDSGLANINVSFKGGEIVADGAISDSGESEEEVIVEVGSEYKGDIESNGNNNADQETSNDGSSSSVSTEGGGDEADNNGIGNVGGGNTAAGVAGSVNSNTNNKKGLTPVVIATIVVVAGVLVILILMGVSSSRRKRKRQREEDKEYLQNAEIGRNDSFQYAMGGLHHLDLSEDSDGDEPGPIVRSELDLEENYSGNLSPTGVEQQQQFFNISGVVRSPSTRQRSQMGPLGMSDEFLDSQSISTAHTDGRKGNHRGDLALTLSLPSSLSPRDLAPPAQNTSPRAYQLRDTVNL